MKLLRRGRFYWHRDGSPKHRHPSQVYKKNDKKNQYNIVCFTSSTGKNRTKLNKNINPKSTDDCYVLNKPQTAKRKDFGRELIDYKVTDKHDKAVIEHIKRKKK